MRIFYILITIILVTTTQAKSQARVPFPETESKIVKFYPNPAISYIIFEIDKEPNQTYTLQIYSFIGKMVKNIPDIVDRYTVNLGDLYRGLYTFQLKDQSGHVTDSGIFQVNK